MKAKPGWRQWAPCEAYRKKVREDKATEHRQALQLYGALVGSWRVVDATARSLAEARDELARVATAARLRVEELDQLYMESRSR